MDNIGALLGQYSPKEPAEIVAVKRYIAEQFDRKVRVGLQDGQLVITVPSAAFAGTLRLRTIALQQAAGTDKRIIFRIG